MNKNNMTDLMTKNYIAVFTDGSSFIDNKSNYYEASSAIVIVINDVEVCRFGCYHNNGTNSIGEIYAMMMAIERISELKKDNPELRDYFTFYISDSKYVVSSLNEWIFNWVNINKNNDIWISSSKKPVAYQWIMKYLYDKYISDNDWQTNNAIIHINGHIGEKDLQVKYGKALKRNNQTTWKYQKFITLETFKRLVSYNHIVDSLAEKIRINKYFYHEEGNENIQWVIRKRKLPIRNQRVVIKSRENKNKI